MVDRTRPAAVADEEVCDHTSSVLDRYDNLETLASKVEEFNLLLDQHSARFTAISFVTIVAECEHGKVHCGLDTCLGSNVVLLISLWDLWGCVESLDDCAVIKVFIELLQQLSSLGLTACIQLKWNLGQTPEPEGRCLKVIQTVQQGIQSCPICCVQWIFDLSARQASIFRGMQ